MELHDEVRAIHAQAAGENFPVALRVLPARYRRPLVAIYGFARLADTIGDESAGDRLARLDWLEAELAAPTHPLVRAVEPVMAAAGPEPFRQLIEANRQDQRVTRYATWENLAAYCQLSAAPVGRLVLTVFGVSTRERIEWSDRVCAGLQLVEHIQDVGEDARRGRVYLPADELARFGCDEHDLLAPSAGPALRAVVAFQADRADALLAAGRELTASLRGWARLAVSGYVAGGRAAVDAVRRAGYDVLGRAPRPTRLGTVRHLVS